jgi:hypothetical protein
MRLQIVCALHALTVLCTHCDVCVVRCCMPDGMEQCVNPTPDICSIPPTESSTTSQLQPPAACICTPRDGKCSILETTCQIRTLPTLLKQPKPLFPQQWLS